MEPSSLRFAEPGDGKLRMVFQPPLLSRRMETKTDQPAWNQPGIDAAASPAHTRFHHVSRV
jgi:hypothetical protein